jgi:hypothetical protein
MKQRVCYTLTFLLLLSKVCGQEQFVQPAAKPLTSFPFTQLTGGIVIVKALIDTIADTLNFVLDTGSGGISFDSATVDEFKWVRVKSDRTVRGIAGMKTVDFTYHHTLILPGLKVENLDFHINDYGILTSVYGVRIDGIIGYSFLRKFIVVINYDTQKIDVYEPGLFKYPKGGYLLKLGFKGLPYQPATVKDEKAILSRFIFDTGAGLCFLLSQDFVEDSMFISKKKRMLPTQTEGLGGKKLMKIMVMKEIDMGPYHFKKVPVYIFNDEFNVTSYPFMGGLTGNDLLRRFNVIINYPEQIIYLKPNSHFSDPFDYSYTGLSIYMEEGEIKVIDIIPGSPGDKAGFQKDDVVYAIDRNFTKNIQILKSALQNAGAKVTVVVMRNNRPVLLHLKIKNLLRK